MLAAFDEAVGFQFIQDFAQRRRADVEHFGQFSLAEAVLLAQQGNDSALASMGVSAATSVLMVVAPAQ